MNTYKITSLGKLAALLFTAMQMTACTSVGHVLNPFYEDPPAEAYLGEKNDHAISGNAQKTVAARGALEEMATKRQAHMPEPTYPIMQPAVVRLLWIPDHLNKYGDLVPAHYYYLKVLGDRPAVQDKFELEQQLGDKNGTSNISYVNRGEYTN